jgi:hypothetical protein
MSTTTNTYWWIEFENDDVGPFASRELAEMAARLNVGSWERLGDDATDDWDGDAQLFRSGLNGTREPIVALVGPRYPSSQVAWWYATKSDMASHEP